MKRSKNNSMVPVYASTWFNTNDKKLRAYNKNNKWVTIDETNDPILIELLSMYGEMLTIAEMMKENQKMRLIP